MKAYRPYRIPEFGVRIRAERDWFDACDEEIALRHTGANATTLRAARKRTKAARVAFENTSETWRVACNALDAEDTN